MGKRSDFKRRERDFYPTPKEAVIPVLPFLEGASVYEPCAGNGALRDHLLENGVWVEGESDIEPQDPAIAKLDAMILTKADVRWCTHIVTNPPWDRKILHPMIDHFRNLKSTWLLFDADWMHTKQSSEYMKHCSMVVSVGRVKWIPDSKMTGKDNCAWYLFQPDSVPCITEFKGR